MEIAIDYLLFSHFWFATPQLVLQADWQEVWHSPQPPFLALSHRLRVSRVLILSITCISDLSDSNGFPGEPPADSHLKIGKILAYHPHKVKVSQRFPPIKNVKKKQIIKKLPLTEENHRNRAIPAISAGDCRIRTSCLTHENASKNLPYDKCCYTMPAKWIAYANDKGKSVSDLSFLVV